MSVIFLDALVFHRFAEVFLKHRSRFPRFLLQLLLNGTTATTSAVEEVKEPTSDGDVDMSVAGPTGASGASDSKEAGVEQESKDGGDAATVHSAPVVTQSQPASSTGEFQSLCFRVHCMVLMRSVSLLFD